MITCTRAFGWPPDVAKRQTMGDLRTLGRNLFADKEG